MTTRKYSSRSQQTTLTGAITSGATSMTVVSGTALLGGVTIPAGQTFTLVIDVDTALEEIVDATAVSTNTFTITRAIDGSTAQDHSAGAVVRHMAIGRDYRDANLHAEADASYNDGSGNAHTMHGIAAGEGVVVGTLKTQTLTNKTLTSPVITNPSITGAGVDASIVFEGATADAHETTLTVVDPTQDNTITLPNTTGTVVLDSATQTLTNKTLTSPVISGTPTITGLSSAGMVGSSATPKDYVDSILGSATAAATSAASAATSAASAATSASSALTSANSASTSATAAATSATSAANSATSANNSANNASASSSSASASAASAATSATSAATSASSALTSANSASTSASSALTSANSAATSASTMAASVAAAQTSATSAAASATAAATSATSAAASATAAATSANSAAVSATTASNSASAAATSATSAAASATAAATSASSASTSASSALTSANSASTSATAAATSASSASTSASSALTSANSASTSATSAATSATSAAASAASANAAASAAPEFRQYASEGSVLNNVPARVADAENLLKQAVWWIDAAHSSASSQTINNLGWGGSALNVTNGSSTSSDSNDARYLDWDGINYVYLPGTSGDFLSVPNATPLQITGNIDLRWYGTLDSVSITQPLINRANSGSTRSYRFEVNNTGTLQLNWSADGPNAVAANSTVAITAVNTLIWLRATLSVASNYEVKFFTSTDGITWTQLGSTVTGTGSTSIFAGNSDVWIGRNVNLAALSGKTYRAQILNGIDGIPVLDVDTSVIASGAATSFTALTGQTVTVNRSTSGRKTVCVVNPVWLFGTDDYMEVNNRWLEHADVSENYVYLNGTSGNYMSSPDAAALDITGDIDLRVRVALDDWTPATAQTLIAKYNTTGNQRSYRLDVSTTGNLAYVWATDGITPITANSSVANGITDGTVKWIRVTHDVDNGASGNDVKFFTSDDGSTWTQLGTTQTTAGTTSIYSGTALQEVGSYNSGTATPAKGRFYRAQVYNGIGGTLVFDADASAITDGTASTFKERSSNAATVTINKSGTGTFASTNNYLYLPGVSGNYASAPDAAPLDITGDIDIRVKVALDDWTPSGTNVLIGKWSDTASNFSYRLAITTTGLLQLNWYDTGQVTTVSVSSSVATGITDGSTKWVRATLDVDNGAGGNTTTFFTSDDGTNWTQLGTTTTLAYIAVIRNGSQALEIGGQTGGTAGISRGKFFRAQVLNGINGTVAFDANFESSITAQLPTTFTESSTNAATVTVNYSGTGYRSAGVLASTYVYPGNPNTFKLSSYDLLAVDANTNLTVMMFRRKWATALNYRGLFGGKGYNVQNYETSNVLYANLSLTTGNINSFESNWTAGAFSYIGLTVNRATARLTTIGTNQNSTPTVAGAVGTSAGFYTQQFRISETDDNEFVGMAIWRRVLTAGEISTIATYYTGRVGA